MTATTRTPKALADLRNLRGEAHGSLIAICWDSESYRHHFWLGDLRAATATQQTDGGALDVPIYRNLPLDHPDSRRTSARTLDSTRGYGKAALDLLAGSILDDLVRQATEQMTAKRMEEDVRAAEMLRAARIRAAAPAMLDALLKFEEAFGSTVDGGCDIDAQDAEGWLRIARAALATIEE